MRDLFYLPDKVCYLNAAYLPAQLKSSEEAGAKALLCRHFPWNFRSADFFEGCDELRSLVGELWNCSGENIALVPSVSYGVETAVKNISVRAGQRVVMPDADFSSNVYPWTNQYGSAVHMVAKPSNGDWTTAMLSAIDSSVAVVSVPQSDWSDGAHFDLEKISARCREVGAALVVDLSQSFGAVPFDLRRFDPDFVFSVGYKWQLGPYGLSYLYVADRHLRGRPLENNWLNRKGSQDFSRLTEYTEDYQPGARRFDGGQHSQFILVPMALAALRFLRDVGAPRIFEHVSTLTARLCQGLEGSSFHCYARDFQTGHMVGIFPRDTALDLNAVQARLRDAKIFASVRRPALRISPHVYNTSEDIDHLLKVLRS